jgi:hypothetical protein
MKKYWFGIIPIISLLIVIMTGIPVIALNYTQISQQITTSSNDVEIEYTEDTMRTNGYSNAGEFGESPGAATHEGSYYRFQLNLPQGTVVQDAKLRWTSAGNETELTRTRIGIDDAVNSTAITNYAGYASKTFVLWKTYDISASWATNSEYTSLDISNLINYALAKSTWVSGNYITIAWEDNGTTGVDVYRMTYDYNNSSTKCCKLEYKITIPLCFTASALYEENTATLRGLVASLGTNTQLKTGFEYGTSVEYGITVYSKNINTVSTPGNIFTYAVNDAIPGLTYNYRAFVEITDGTKYYGSNFTFNTAGSGGVIHTLPATDISYNEATIGYTLAYLGTNTIVDINLKYGTTIACTSTATIDEDITQPYFNELKLTSLLDATKYYYKIEAVGDVNTFYGNTLYFTTDDSSKSTLVNKGTNLLNRIGLGFGAWWLVLLLLMLLIWLIPSIREHSWLGVTFDLIILGAGIALSVVDIWIVILLAVGAGITIFGIIIGHKRASD